MNATFKIKSEREVRFEDTSPEFNAAWQRFALRKFDLAARGELATVEDKFVHVPLPIPEGLEPRWLRHSRRETLGVGRFVLLDFDEPTEVQIDDLKDEFVWVFIAHSSPLGLQANKTVRLKELTENGATPRAYILPAKKPNALERFLRDIGVGQPMEFTVGAPREVPAFYRQFQEQPHYEVREVIVRPVYRDPDLVIARYADGRLFYGGNIDLFVVKPTSTARLFLLG